jgi:DNA-binding GntR family transcriptional regulator
MLRDAETANGPDVLATPALRATEHVDAGGSPIPRGRGAPDLPSQVAAGIREMINEGALPPGSPLLQQQLAVRFGVSRAPVREALKQLVAEAAVEHDPNRGFEVAMLSSHEARQLYQIRRLLETELLRTARWPTADELAILRANLGRLDVALAASARADWLRAYSRFQALVVGLSSERVIAQEAMRLIRQTDRYRALAPPSSWGARFPAAPEHHLVDALAGQDRDVLLTSYRNDRVQVETHLLNSLEARGL